MVSATLITGDVGIWGESVTPMVSVTLITGDVGPTSVVEGASLQPARLLDKIWYYSISHIKVSV
jgi:hypothetical protein